MTSFLNQLSKSTTLSVSTVASNGDLNPYGVAIVPNKFPKCGKIASGNILVSNFNNSANLQGTGTSIIAVDTTNNNTSTFFTAPSNLGQVGLTAALVVFNSGIVVVGNTPTIDGTFNTISAGSLIFLDNLGNVLLNFVHPLIQGPWGMTSCQIDKHHYILYVSNVLNGTIVRIRFSFRKNVIIIKTIKIIATGFGHRPDPNALVIGPTGLLLYNKNLYVCDTYSNRIQVLSNFNGSTPIGTGSTLFSGSPLQGPLGISLSPENTLVVSNGDAINAVGTNNSLVEININNGSLISTLVPPFNSSVSPFPSGALFGITIGKVNNKPSLVYVDDVDNAVDALEQL